MSHFSHCQRGERASAGISTQVFVPTRAPQPAEAADAHEVAKRLLERAETFGKRMAAVYQAGQLGMSLEEIEAFLAEVDARRPDRAARF